MIYYLTLSHYFIDICIVLQGNISLTFSLMSYSSEGHIKSMFSLIICDMFVLISFSSQPQINFVTDLPFQTRELEPHLLLTVMKYMFKKEDAH